jgi:glycosyltransferase involved in cell wall biosynthesis
VGDPDRTLSCKNRAQARFVAAGLRVLYLSYDGMADPLGASQVLPYLVELSRLGHEITLVSFEKPQSSQAEWERAAAVCAEAGISWHPLKYTKQPPVLSTLRDIIRMNRAARALHLAQSFDIVHCRSYVPALVGQSLQRRFGMGFVFDMRGFWADERVDGGLWSLRNPVFKAVYGFFKREETKWLHHADHVICLTEEGRRVLLSRPDRREDDPPISVIPCCVDFDRFPPVDSVRRERARESLGIDRSAPVAAYLGSIGTWYMLDEMLGFFRVQLDRNPNAVFLFVTRDEPSQIANAARSHRIPASALRIQSASREEVPELIAAADYGLFFIKPCFSKKASSPTKLGEFLALELPFVANAGVGDVDLITKETSAGVLVQSFDAPSYSRALEALQRRDVDLVRWRKAASRWFDLNQGVERYNAIYRGLAPRGRLQG